MCLAQAADVFGAGIVAGAFFIGTVAIHPAADQLETSAHVLLRQELIRRLTKYMPPFMLLPVVASVAAMILCPKPMLRILDLFGLLLSLATVGITVIVNAPLNRRFARWSADAMPTDWTIFVRRWNVAHGVRMTTAIAAFGCAALAAS
jgi:uncharacterized membrane protein